MDFDVRESESKSKSKVDVVWDAMVATIVHGGF